MPHLDFHDFPKEKTWHTLTLSFVFWLVARLWAVVPFLFLKSHSWWNRLFALPLIYKQINHFYSLKIFMLSTQREVTFDAYLASNNRELKLSVLFMGFRAWDITYDGEMIFEERTSQVPQELQANYLLRDITLSYWPASNIMRQSPKLLIVDKPHERLIQDRESADLLLSIRYLDNAGPTSPIGRLILTNHKEHYQLSIDSREP